MVHSLTVFCEGQRSCSGCKEKKRQTLLRLCIPRQKRPFQSSRGNRSSLSLLRVCCHHFFCFFFPGFVCIIIIILTIIIYYDYVSKFEDDVYCFDCEVTTTVATHECGHIKLKFFKLHSWSLLQFCCNLWYCSVVVERPKNPDNRGCNCGCGLFFKTLMKPEFLICYEVEFWTWLVFFSILPVE